MIGSMESLSAISPQFESKRHLRSVYYQVKSAAHPGRSARQEIAQNRASLPRGQVVFKLPLNRPMRI